MESFFRIVSNICVQRWHTFLQMAKTLKNIFTQDVNFLTCAEVRFSHVF